MEGIQKPRKPRGTWKPGRRMEKMRGGEGKGTNMGEKKKSDFLWQGFCDPWNVSPVGSDRNYSCSCFTSQLTEVWSH